MQPTAALLITQLSTRKVRSNRMHLSALYPRLYTLLANSRINCFFSLHYPFVLFSNRKARDRIGSRIYFYGGLKLHSVSSESLLHISF